MFVLTPNIEVNPDARKISAGAGLFPEHPVQAYLDSKLKESWGAGKSLLIWQCSQESISGPKWPNLHFIKDFFFSLFYQLYMLFVFLFISPFFLISLALRIFVTTMELCVVLL